MPTKIICLANSKKFNERCVAGIEVKKRNTGGYDIVQNEIPKWIRPVSRIRNGAFPGAIAQSINLLDVIEFNLINECPAGYQSENVYFDANSVKKVGRIGLSNDNLDMLTHNRNNLFGNYGKAVHSDDVEYLNYSLMLIKIPSEEFLIKRNGEQFRMDFEYNNIQYDLPITDISFLASYKANQNILNDAQSLYLTISLAVVHNSWHSKLIAGIIWT